MSRLVFGGFVQEVGGRAAIEATRWLISSTPAVVPIASRHSEWAPPKAVGDDHAAAGDPFCGGGQISLDGGAVGAGAVEGQGEQVGAAALASVEVGRRRLVGIEQVEVARRG